MPLAVVDDARHTDGRVPAAQVEAQVRHPFLQLDGGEIRVVYPGHVEDQARLGLSPDLELDDESAGQTGESGILKGANFIHNLVLLFV